MMGNVSILTFRILVMTMGDRFKYEKPVLIDMTLGTVLGGADCNYGYGVSECGSGSCISKGDCQYGLYTGYCWTGNFACGTSVQCYICCDDGSMVGSYMGKYGKGITAKCWCNSGSAAAESCENGTRTSWACNTGDYYDGACASW